MTFTEGLSTMTFTQGIPSIVLAGILLVGVSCEISFFFPKVRHPVKHLVNLWYQVPRKSRSILERISQVATDFRAYRYYQPWKSGVDIIIVSEKRHIVELSEAPELSQRAVYADMFGFKYTLNKFDHNQQKSARSRFFSRVLQVKGPSQLAIIFPELQSRAQSGFEKQFNTGLVLKDGWVSLKLVPTMKRVVSGMMGIAFFGEELMRDEAFANALLQHPQDMVNSMGAFQIVPNSLAPLVHKIITKNGKAMHLILKHMKEEFERAKRSDYTFKPTILDNMAKLNPDPEYWTSEMLAQALLGIWFAAAHQPWMNLDFIMLELCRRPDYVQDLRAEIMGCPSPDYDAVEKLPLLDSFIKEAVRFNPLDRLAIRRKAMRPFTFSHNGPKVAEGQTVCVSLIDAMHNENHYKDANAFVGNRFISNVSRFTEVSENFPIWGFGSLACPGRFHASIMIKLVLIHLIGNFEFQLEEPNMVHQWRWETFTMPFNSTKVQFRK